MLPHSPQRVPIVHQRREPNSDIARRGMKKEKRTARRSRGVPVRPQASSDGSDAVVRPEPQSGVIDAPLGTPPDIEGWLPTLLETLDDAYFFHDADGRVLDTNASAWRSLGYERDDLMALTLPDFQGSRPTSGSRTSGRKCLRQKL